MSETATHADALPAGTRTPYDMVRRVFVAGCRCGETFDGQTPDDAEASLVEHLDIERTLATLRGEAERTGNYGPYDELRADIRDARDGS